MDFVLQVADDLILDKAWASLVPLSAFTTPPTPLSSPTVMLNSTMSAWTSILRTLPHPPLPNNASNLIQAGVASAWPREYIPRQVLSLTLLTAIGIHLLYFIFAPLSYYYIFNHEMMRHPKFLKNQVRLEIQSSLKALPTITLLTVPWFQAEVMGYSKMYDDPSDYGWTYMVLSVPL